MKRLVVVLLLLAPVALPGLAFASPPDPAWIPGVYDDGDGDDVVSLIASGTGHLPPGAPTDLVVLVRRVARLAPTPERTSRGLWASAVPPRAPPTS